MVYEMDRSGAEVFKQTYDVYASASAAAAMAADLNYICDNRKGNIVVVYTYDEPYNFRGWHGLPAAMYRCGASRVRFGSPEFHYRAAYILVGVAGCNEGNAVELLTPGGSNAWAELGFQIHNGVLTVSGANGGPRTLFDLGPVQAENIAVGALYQSYNTRVAGPIGWNGGIS
jgi:hypothetical protein